MTSSLHWIISLSFCLNPCNEVCFIWLKLSVSDVIVGQKGSNGEGKEHFFGRDQGLWGDRLVISLLKLQVGWLLRF